MENKDLLLFTAELFCLLLQYVADYAAGIKCQSTQLHNDLNQFAQQPSAWSFQQDFNCCIR